MSDSASYLLTDLIGGAAPRPGKKPAVTLDSLASKVERLSPHHRQPERFHEDKSEIVAELRRLAREVRHG